MATKPTTSRPQAPKQLHTDRPPTADPAVGGARTSPTRVTTASKRKPLGLPGRYDIHIYQPTPCSKYFQIGWTQDGQWRTTTAGTTEQSAAAKANKIAAMLDSGANKSMKTVAALCSRWSDPDRPRQRAWGPKHSQEVNRVLDSYVRPTIGSVRCADLTRQDVQRAVSAAPTIGEGDRTRRILRTALRWGYRDDWLVKDPEKLLADVFWGSGATTVTRQGTPAAAVAREAIPTNEAVEELAWAMCDLSTARSQDGLAVFLAAYTGLRLGELLALRVGDIDVERNRIEVTRQVIEVTGGCRLKLPKWEKLRTTILPEVTPGGYRLAEGVQARIDEIRLTDDSPDALLLTAPGEGMWIPSRWGERRVRPAARGAGWETYPDVRGGKPITRFVWTWHSLRHTFASWMLWEKRQSPADVAAAMGHADVTTTLRKYATNPSGPIDRLARATWA